MFFVIMAGLIVLCLMILIHEFGHFIAAKICGVKVEGFSIGFWKVLWSFTYRDTEYRISAIPFGGYVKLKGEYQAEEGSEIERCYSRDSLYGCGYVRRTAIMLSGPFANALLAFVCYAASLLMVAQITPPVVGTVEPNGIIAVAGIKPGDRIIQFGHVEISSWKEITREILFAEGSVAVTVLRNGKALNLKLNFPATENTKGPEIFFLKTMGAVPVDQMESYHPGLIETFVKSWQALALMCGIIGKTFIWLATGVVPVSSINGPVMIVKLSGDMASLGLVRLLSFMSFISLNIGLTNLLPIPLMDGGQVVLATIEAVRRKAFRYKTVERLSWASLAVLGSLMVFTVVNDVRLLLKM